MKNTVLLNDSNRKCLYLFRPELRTNFDSFCVLDTILIFITSLFTCRYRQICKRILQSIYLTLLPDILRWEILFLLTVWICWQNVSCMSVYEENEMFALHTGVVPDETGFAERLWKGLTYASSMPTPVSCCGQVVSSASCICRQTHRTKQGWENVHARVCWCWGMHQICSFNIRWH